jgi:hypothetical protein
MQTEIDRYLQKNKLYLLQIVWKILLFENMQDIQKLQCSKCMLIAHMIPKMIFPTLSILGHQNLRMLCFFQIRLYGFKQKFRKQLEATTLKKVQKPEISKFAECLRLQLLFITFY